MRNVLRRYGTAAAALLCGMGVAFNAAAATAPKPPAASERSVVRIGALVDLTSSSTSPDFRGAIELAAKQMNQALARAGSPLGFEIAFGDTVSDPAKTLAEAQRLVGTEHVQALISDSSGDTAKANGLNYDPAAGLTKVPVTCFQCSSSFFHDPTVVEKDPVTQAAERDADHWLFRVFYNARYEAAVIVRLAVEKANAGKAAHTGTLRIGIFADDGHRSLAEQIPHVLPELYKGPAAVDVHYVTTTEKIGADWADVVKGKDGAPDVVIVAMLPGHSTEAIRTYRAAGYKLPIVSNNSFRRDYILQQIGPAANGLDGSSVTTADKSKSGAAFVHAFRAAYGHAPEVTSSGAYDAATTLMLAAVVASGEGPQPHAVTAADIHRGLTQINEKQGRVILPTVADFTAAVRLARTGKPINYQGAYDATGWDAVGDIFPPLVHWTVVQGHFVEHELYDCTPQHPLCPPVK
jgi:ABC-type branched-subunit amino acid transport system substrate-binding protein